MVVDVEKAHQQVPINECDWGHVGCSIVELPPEGPLRDAWPIILKTVGTYGVASASWHWARIASLFQRIALYLVGALSIFRFADDFMILSTDTAKFSYNLDLCYGLSFCVAFSTFL